MISYQDLAQYIQNAQRILLTTHKNCDADGFGSELAMYYALKSLNKDIDIVHQEPVHERYHFLDIESLVRVYTSNMFKNKPDLILVFDTNDPRLITPIFKDYENTCPIIFVDHHQLSKESHTYGPTIKSIIDTTSASTGQMVYELIQTLKIPLNKKIAHALYTSIAFDTHIFKYIRSSQKSYEIAAELLKFNIDSTHIHQMLFANAPIQKLAFLSYILKQVEFSHKDQVALCVVTQKDMQTYRASIEETHDILDHIMSIGACVLSVLIRELDTNTYRLSFRSKEPITILKMAETFGGGGHNNAAGATVHMSLPALKAQILQQADLAITKN